MENSTKLTESIIKLTIIDETPFVSWSSPFFTPTIGTPREREREKVGSSSAMTGREE